MFKQILEYFEPILSTFQRSFRKEHSVQQLSTSNVRKIEISR